MILLMYRQLKFWTMSLLLLTLNYHPDSIHIGPFATKVAWAEQINEQGDSAEEFFVIRDVQVQGLVNVDLSVIFGSLGYAIGDKFYPKQNSAQVIGNIFATGFFQDIVLDEKNGVLIIQVVENPIINEISFNGNDLLKQDDLLDNLRRVGVVEGGVLRSQALDDARRLLEFAYNDSSYFQIQIDITTSPLPDNRVIVNFQFAEGEQASVSRIEIIGADQVGAETLLDEVFELDDTGIIAWLSDDNLFTNTKLSGELSAMENYYLRNGYIDYKLEDVDVELLPNLQDIAIQIQISEGDHYLLGEIDWLLVDFPETDVLEFDQTQRDALLDLDDSSPYYNAERIERSIAQIKDYFGNFGFFSARVDSQLFINEQEKIVDITFSVEPGRIAYIRRIEILGNYHTEDEVIRRYLTVFEQSPFSLDSLKLSISRLRRLRYFDSVDYQIQRTDRDDVIDVIINLEEGAIGNIGFALTYSEQSSFGFEVTFDDLNFLGSGNAFGVGVGLNSQYRFINFSYSEPYINFEGWTRKTGLSYQERTTQNTNISSFSTETSSALHGYDIPIGSELFLGLDVLIRTTKIVNGHLLAPIYRPFFDRYGSRINELQFQPSLVYDTTNSGLAPSSGQKIDLSSSVSVPVFNLRYHRSVYMHDVYFELDDEKQNHLHQHAQIGYGEAFAGHEYPFYRRFFAGGAETIRGFSPYTVSPRVNQNGRIYGGKFVYIGNSEYVHPLDVFDGQRINLAAFVDYGAAVDNYREVTYDNTRVSAGAELRWLSPIGVVKFIYARPVKKKDNDQVENFSLVFSNNF